MSACADGTCQIHVTEAVEFPVLDATVSISLSGKGHVQLGLRRPNASRATILQGSDRLTFGSITITVDGNATDAAVLTIART